MSVTIKRTGPGARRVYQRLGDWGKREVAVGFPAGKAQAYPDGTEVAFVAACHVYGLGVPRRDFMRLALRDITQHTRGILIRAAKEQDAGKREALLAAAGERAKADIQKAITDLSEPPLAPATIARKGSDNPLIDTGHMRQSVTYVVRDRGSNK